MQQVSFFFEFHSSDFLDNIYFLKLLVNFLFKRRKEEKKHYIIGFLPTSLKRIFG